jgi:hypothetical protein
MNTADMTINYNAYTSAGGEINIILTAASVSAGGYMLTTSQWATTNTLIAPTNIPYSITTTVLFDFSQDLIPNNTFLLNGPGVLCEINLWPITAPPLLSSYFLRIFVNATNGPQLNMIAYIYRYPPGC